MLIWMTFIVTFPSPPLIDNQQPAGIWIRSILSVSFGPYRLPKIKCSVCFLTLLEGGENTTLNSPPHSREKGLSCYSRANAECKFRAFIKSIH